MLSGHPFKKQEKTMSTTMGLVGAPGGGEYYTNAPPPFPAEGKLLELLKSSDFQNANPAERQAMLKELLKDMSPDELRGLMLKVPDPAIRLCIAEVLREKTAGSGDKV